MAAGVPVPCASVLLRPGHPAHPVVLPIAIGVYGDGRRVGVPVGGLKGPDLVAAADLHTDELGAVLAVGTIPISGDREYHLEVVRVRIEVGDDRAW